MSLLFNGEEITKTLGYLKSFRFNFKDTTPIQVDEGLFLVPYSHEREDIKYLNFERGKMNSTFNDTQNYGTYVLHVLNQKRNPSMYESYYKFYNLVLTVRLMCSKECSHFMDVSYDDSILPIKFYSAFISRNEDVYTNQDDFSILNPSDLERLKKIFKAIECNTEVDAHQSEKYTRLNNALRFYRISYDTDFHLMKLVMFFIVIESLFSDKDDHSDISYKVRLRAAHLLYPSSEDLEQRKKVFEHIKHGYDIRSKLLHGDNVEKLIETKQKTLKIGDYPYLYDFLPILNKIVSDIIVKILEDENNLNFFSKNQNPSSDKIFFNNLVL